MAQLFISYTQDSPQRKAEVKALSEALKAEGVDVILDQDQPPSGPREGWPTWSGRVAEVTERVLIIASQNYLDCWHGRHPPGVRNGATHEAITLQNRVYEHGAGNDFLRVAWLDPAEKAFIPLRLKGPSYFDGKNPASIVAWLQGTAPAAVMAVAAAAPSSSTVVAAPGIPFSIHAPAEPRAFVGREKTLRLIEHLMDKGGGVSLVGDARIGKSSLLLKIAEMARRSGHPVAQVDCQSLNGFGLAGIVRQMTAGQVTPTAAQCTSADEAGELISSWVQRQTQRPVILVDEAEGIIRELDLRFFERLRGMMEHVCLVMATRQTLPVLFQQHRQVTSPFGNKMSTESVGLLEEAAAQVLAERAGPHSGLLRLWGGAHPFYLQLLGWALAEGPDEATALQRFRQTAENRLAEQWERLRPGEQKGLQNAAQGMEVNGHLRPGLHERGLLLADGRPFARVLTWWLQREAALQGL